MSDSPATIYAIAIVFTLLALGATALRFYARSIKKIHLSWDDWAIIPALVLSSLMNRCETTQGLLIILDLHNRHSHHHDHRYADCDGSVDPADTTGQVLRLGTLDDTLVLSMLSLMENCIQFLSSHVVRQSSNKYVLG